MKIAVSAPFNAAKCKVVELEKDIYIAIGNESEIILYPNGHSKQAQIRVAKKLCEDLWDALNEIDNEPEEWGVGTPSDVLTAALNQDAYDEEMPWEKDT